MRPGKILERLAVLSGLDSAIAGTASAGVGRQEVLRGCLMRWGTGKSGTCNAGAVRSAAKIFVPLLGLTRRRQAPMPER
jgi:hypothetical protein